MQVTPEVLEAARRGDRGAFEAIVRETHRSVYSLVFRIVANHEDAADVTQDVYVKLWRSLSGFRGDAAFSTWLFRVATNAAISHLRKRPRTEPIDETTEVAERAVDWVEGRADADLLQAALARLPAGQRAAVVLKDVYGMSCQEIAKEMGLTEGAVKVRLFRARQRLADDLASADIVVDLAKRRKGSR